MTTSARSPGAPRFIAFSTLTREAMMADASASQLLTLTREVPSLGFDNRFVEVLDCGPSGPDASTITASLDDARAVYHTVYRGSGALGQPGMPALALKDPALVGEPPTVPPPVVEELAMLVERARVAGQPGVVSILQLALFGVRAEMERRPDENVPMSGATRPVLR